jgi:hypothetical protein
MKLFIFKKMGRTVIIRLSEISQSYKDKHMFLSHSWKLQGNKDLPNKTPKNPRL